MATHTPPTEKHPESISIPLSKVEVALPRTAKRLVVAEVVPTVISEKKAAAIVVEPIIVPSITPPLIVRVSTTSVSVIQPTQPPRDLTEDSLDLFLIVRPEIVISEPALKSTSPVSPFTSVTPSNGSGVNEIIGVVVDPVIVTFVPATTSFTTFAANNEPSPSNTSAPLVIIPPSA